MPSRLELLGSPKLFDSTDAPVAPLPAKTLAILAYLALSGTPQRRQDLARVFWPRYPAPNARKSVRQAIWLLRKSLTDVLVGDDPVSVDLAALETDVAPFLESLHTGNLNGALALWRGPFLDGLVLPDAPEWDRWVEDVRSDLEARLASALVVQAEVEMSGGNAAAAVSLLERARQLQPSNGRYAARLLEAVFQLGDMQSAAEALARVREDLGDTDAGIEYAALEERLQALRIEQLAGSPPLALRAQLVGRDREMAMLRRAWRKARVGRTRTVVLAGESGIGKTRLAQEISQIAKLEGGMVVWVRASEGEATIRWGLIAELTGKLLQLRGAMGVSESSHALLHSLTPSLPVHGSPSIPPPDHPEPAALADALEDLVGAVAWETPLLVIADDLHWADPTSVAVLSRVCRQLGADPCLFLLLHRPGHSAEAVLRAVAALRETATTLHLSSLALEDVSGLLRELVEVDGSDDRVTLSRQAYETTGGNPLFVLEFVRTLQGRGVLEMRGDHLALRADRIPGEYPVPSTIQDAMDRRLDGLSPDAQVLAGALADLGRTRTLAEAARRSGLSGPRFSHAAAELVRREIIVRPPEDGLDFTHDELRRAVRRRFPFVAASRHRLKRAVRYGIPAAAALLLAAYILGMRAFEPEPAPPPYGGGSIFVWAADSALEIRPSRTAASGWMVRPPSFWYPRGTRIRGPFRTTSRELLWYREAQDPKAHPYIVREWPDGTETTLVRTGTDTNVGAPSPDGRYIAYLSDNPETAAYDIDVYVAKADGTRRRRIHRSDEETSWVSWSPGGTRIVFVVRAASDTLVVVTPAGDRVATFPFPSLAASAWCGENRVAAVAEHDQRLELVLIDLDQRLVRPVSRQAPFLGGLDCSPAGDAVVYLAAVGYDAGVVVQPFSTDSIMPLPVKVPTLSQAFVRWLPDSLPAVPEAVRIRNAPAHLVWGARAPLSAGVLLSNGQEDVRPVDWTSSDPSVVSVGADGVISANQPGRARIAATFAAWLADTVEIQVEDAGTRALLLRDELTSLDSLRWITVGSPVPRPEIVEGQTVLSMRGDGIGDDGIIHRAPLSLSQGATLELEYRTAFTRRDRQRVNVCFADIRPRPGRSGHEEGDWSWHDEICYQDPAEELSKFDPRTIALNVGLWHRDVVLPVSIPPGQWRHLAIQVRPDGVASFFVDRTLLGQSDLRLHTDQNSEWRVVIRGAAVDTDVLVRNLVVWPGQRY